MNARGHHRHSRRAATRDPWTVHPARRAAIGGAGSDKWEGENRRFEKKNENAQKIGNQGVNYSGNPQSWWQASRDPTTSKLTHTSTQYPK
jgi:hypothetical protein